MATKVTLEEVLLPKDVRPIRYDIHLTPDLVSCTFRGTVSIKVSIERATRTVVLHAHQLAVDVDSVKLVSSGASVALKSFTQDVAAQKASFTFDKELAVGEATISMAFTGMLNDDLAGFYRSAYTVRGEKRWSAVTQFEATDARRAFPCFDEPAWKAVFGMTVTAPVDRVVLSNMAATRTDTSACGKLKTITFMDTPIMSSYLVGLVVGEFDSVSAVGKNGVLTSIYTPLGQAAKGTFALNTGVRALELFERRFGHKYVGGCKCDHIAIASFAAGAMENTGCITYREAVLLVDEATSSLATKQRVAQVVAHELSHQWFGNLATMDWWTQLWLNEGFAKMMEYVATNELFPEWNTFATFVATTQSSAFALDALKTTHPIEVPVAHPDEVNEIFDLISYNKGASVIRMLIGWLGEDVFFAGIHRYLDAYKHKNATTNDLWDVLAAVSGQPVRDVMRQWTAHGGYPFLLASGSLAAGEGLSLRSGRFMAPWARKDDAWPGADDFARGPGIAAFDAAAAAHAPAAGGAGAGAAAAEAEDSNSWWNIPLSAVTGAGAGTAPATHKLGVLMLAPPEGAAAAAPSRDSALSTMAGAITDAARKAGASYVKLNAEHASFVRTIYDSALLEALLPAAATPSDGSGKPSLSVIDRIGLVGDVAAGFSTGLNRAGDVLRLLWACRFEADYNVFVALSGALGAVQAAADGASPELGAAVKGFARAFLRPAVARLGWEAVKGEDANTPLLRALVLRDAAGAGDEAVTAEALRRFDAAAASPIAADLRQLVYSTAAAAGGAPRWERLYAMFKAADSSEEQRRCLVALGRTPDAALLRRALGMVTDEASGLRSQDAPFLFQAIAGNPAEAGRRVAWEALSTRWDELHGRFGSGNFLWSSVVEACTGSFSSKADADAIAAFFVGRDAGSAARGIKQNLEATRNRAWRAHIIAREAAADGLVDAIGRMTA